MEPGAVSEITDKEQLEKYGKLAKPYGYALKGKWKDMKNFYSVNPELILEPLSIFNDTAVHLAVHGDRSVFLELVECAPDENMKKVNALGNNVLSEVAMTNNLELAKGANNLELAKTVLKKCKDSQHLKESDLLEMPNKKGETPVFIAASSGNTEILQLLGDRVRDGMGRGTSGEVSVLHLRRTDSRTILHMAVLGQRFETALELVKWKEVDKQWIDDKGLTCLQYLANMPSAFRSGNRLGILRGTVYICMPSRSRMQQRSKAGRWKKRFGGWLAKITRENVPNELKVTVFSKINFAIWSYLAKEWPAIQKLWNMKKSHNSALELTKVLVKTDRSWTKNPTHHGMDPGDIDISIFNEGKRTLTQDGELVEGPPWIKTGTSRTKSSARHEMDPGIADISMINEGKRTSNKKGEQVEEQHDPHKEDHQKQEDLTQFNDIPLLVATEQGIIEMVQVILEEHPQAIEYVNKEGANVLHVAVRNRRTKIFEYLLSFKNQLARLIRTFDSHGNSLLHQTAVTGDYERGYQPRKRPGEALHMQWEIQWFEKVNELLPDRLFNHQNKEVLTAREWFNNNHTELATKGEEWLRRTAESCSVVAALISTVAFTSAYTIPGGTDEDTGLAIFLLKQAFVVFTASDTLSLSFALTSLVIFLSIMTSPFHQKDFHRTLPLRLVFGLTSLFLSVTSMMIAFAATLVLMFDKDIHLAAIPFYSLACFPVVIFLILQLPLYLRLSWYTIKDPIRRMVISIRIKQFAREQSD